MKQIHKIAQDYFDYLARRFPVMCASDEFYFLPRVRKAAEFLDSLDSLDGERIKQAVADVKSLKRALCRIEIRDLDDQIDAALLHQSMSAFLIEFERLNSWQIDPSLYLKIALLGIEQILNRFALLKQDFHGNIRARVAQIPRLLNEAKRNLKSIPYAYLERASEFTGATINYFKSSALIGHEHPQTALLALQDFYKFLIKRPARIKKAPDPFKKAPDPFLKDMLEQILRDSYSYSKGLKEIFELAQEEYQATLAKLAQIAKQLKPQQSWQEILAPYKIDAENPSELLAMYTREVQRLKRFLSRKDVLTIPPSQRIMVEATPQFMQPIRASASYSAPVTGDRREPAYFFITPGAFSDIHNEYLFVTAHETYPGHHLLDTLRRRLANPIRQQIESPLFYEGWASYAERLIDELGYIESPLQRMIGLRRQAWRTVRAMLDVGIRINKLKLADARQMLLGLGYGPKTVRLMLRHYLLTVGYQLCYTVGKFEFQRLRRKFARRLGLKRFHDFILREGQIPFTLLERRIKQQLCRKNS